ncbi:MULTISPECIES: sugar phosphate isomerase/epimerase family protein [Micrococcales]|uniref:sugar phosphate isomerase/epimerase family protein n=1 Tax=Micrococcales TaxID=85006 RepID=UPI0004AA5AB7|nr:MULTISPECIES: sugar phosphate isomerase/epimerase [Micrococcales]
MAENTSDRNLIIGTAPDSWGVWFPDDERQTPWQRFLDEVAEAGYRWIELGPYGYLPADPQTLARELKERDLKISAGTVFTAFHRGADQWEEAWKPARQVAELTAEMGAHHVVVIPALWRDDKTGEALEDRTLTDWQWEALGKGHDKLGERLQREFGLYQQFHSHADSHVETMEQIEKFLAMTDPKLVTLCLDTGHAEYGGASSVELIEKYPERIGYLHLKQVHPDILATVRAEDKTFKDATAAGVMCEPPQGLPDLRAVIEAAERLERPLFGIVEQDMYPVESFDVPLPIASRTCKYLLSCGARTTVA